MSKLPKIKKDVWYRGRRLELEHPGRLSFQAAIKEDLTMDDDEGIAILERREAALKTLIEKARRDREYINRRSEKIKYNNHNR